VLHGEEIYTIQILHMFFRQLVDEDKLYDHFQQDYTTAHTAEDSMQVLNSVLGKRLYKSSLLAPCSAAIIPCDFFLWKYLRDKIY
jgi:hypothetical protein